MKSSKRILSLFVTLIFVLSSIASVPVFAGTDFTDVAENHAHYEAITSLVGDGVINGYEDGTFKPENTITRAEFSKLLAVASAPRGTQFNAVATTFSDVADSSSSSAWAIPYIAYAVGTGAINGYEDGTFRPTNNVTYGEAIKMIVCTLGYEPVIDKTLTPWYQGYIDVSNQIGLSKNAVALGDTPAPRALVAQLIYNMLDCKPLVQTGVDANGNPTYGTNGFGGSGGGSFNDSKDNAGSDYGVLMGVYEYCLTDEPLKKSEVLIDDDVFNIGDLDIKYLKELVGSYVKFQYSNVNKDVLTKVTKDSGNNVIDIESWQIVDVDANGIEYYENEDAEYDDDASTVSFSNNFAVVYNGVPVSPSDINTTFINNYLNVENGNMKLISNDGNDKSAEVVVVESFTTYFVSSVSTSNGITTVYDKNSDKTQLPALALDEYDVTSVKKITSKTGSLADSTLTGITKNSILDIALPYNSNEGAYAYVSTSTVTGTVKEMSSDYEDLKIGTESYEVSPYFRTLIDLGADIKFDINDSGKFYLDYLGRIAYFEKTDSSNPYGLLIRYATGEGMDSGYMIEIMTTNGSKVQYPLKDKVRVNGEIKDDSETLTYIQASRSLSIDKKIAEAKAAIDANDSIVDKDAEKAKYDKYIVQPIRYATTTQNGKTVIGTIECMDPNNYENGYIKPYKITNNVNTTAAYFANGGVLQYFKTGYTFKNTDDNTNQFIMSTSAVVFVVPNDITDIAKYKKYGASGFTDEIKYEVEPYDVEASKAGAVIYYQSASSAVTAQISASTPVYFINSVGDVNDANGNSVKNITYIKAGETEAKTIKTDFDEEIPFISSLKSGDIVKFAGNPISTLLPVYTVNEEGNGVLTEDTGSYVAGYENNWITRNYSASKKDYFQAIKGTIFSASVEDKVIRMIPGFYDDANFNGSDYTAFAINDDTVYYKYNAKAEAFETTTIEEIRAYEEFADVDASNATQALTIIVDEKVIAVYIIGE